MAISEMYRSEQESVFPLGHLSASRGYSQLGLSPIFCDHGIFLMLSWFDSLIDPLSNLLGVYPLIPFQSEKLSKAGVWRYEEISVLNSVQMTTLRGCSESVCNPS